MRALVLLILTACTAPVELPGADDPNTPITVGTYAVPPHTWLGIASECGNGRRLTTEGHCTHPAGIEYYNPQPVNDSATRWECKPDNITDNPIEVTITVICN